MAVAAERPMRVPSRIFKPTIRCDRNRDGLCCSRIAQSRYERDRMAGGHTEAVGNNAAAKAKNVCVRSGKC